MRPAVGTWCHDCRIKGHNCQAQLFLDGLLPVCLPCADGEPCSVERVAAQSPKPEYDVFDTVLPISAKGAALLKAILPDNSADGSADDKKSARWHSLLGKGAQDLIAQAHDDIKAEKHLDRAEIANKRATLTPQEKSEALVPKTKRKGLLGKAWQKSPLPEKTVKQPENAKVTPDMEVQIVMDFQGGMSVNAVANKYEITWLIADGIRKRVGVAPKPGGHSTKCPQGLTGCPESCCPIKCSVAETPVTVEEVFDEVFPAKPVTKLTGLHDWTPMDAVSDMLKPAPRVSIAFDLSEAEAVTMFGNLSTANKAKALRSVLSALLCTS